MTTMILMEYLMVKSSSPTKMSTIIHGLKTRLHLRKLEVTTTVKIRTIEAQMDPS